jgi:hypothetical protein
LRGKGGQLTRGGRGPADASSRQGGGAGRRSSHRTRSHLLSAGCRSPPAASSATSPAATPSLASIAAWLVPASQPRLDLTPRRTGSTFFLSFPLENDLKFRERSPPPAPLNKDRLLPRCRQKPETPASGFCISRKSDENLKQT